MKLKTNTGELYFNPQLISHIHLNSDHSLLTFHFVSGTAFGLSTETDMQSAAAAEFLGKLTDPESGFVAVGNEVLNLKAALWIAIPDDGPVQVRSADNRIRSIENGEGQRIRTIMAE